MEKSYEVEILLRRSKALSELLLFTCNNEEISRFDLLQTVEILNELLAQLQTHLSIREEI